MNPPVLDSAVFVELQDSAGAEFVTELVATFCEEAPAMLLELRAAQAAGATERYRRAAHSLKSNCLTFGALELAALAREQELGGLPAVAASLEALEVAFARTAAALGAACHG